MRAAVTHAFTEPLTVEEVRDPHVPPDGALIEVRATGLCRSDWHGWMGHDPAIRLPHVPGHELAGVVAAVGAEVHGVRPGDRVTHSGAPPPAPAPFTACASAGATCKLACWWAPKPSRR